MPQLLGKQIGSTGLTWRAQPPSEDQAFKAMRASLEAGANFWNAGEIYGTPEFNSLHLLNRYFTKYPEDAEKVVLSVKGGLVKMIPDGTPEGIRRSVGNCVKILDGKKKIDIFEMARVDRKTPLETTLKALEEEVKAGNIGGIGLSEVSGATIEKAASITKIVAIEVEFSLWSLDILSNGVAKAAAKNNIPVVAYSPMGRGMLTGEIQKPEDIPEGDMRRSMPRFSKENFDKNLELVKDLQKIAKQKNCTPAQLALGWVKYVSKRDGNPEIIPIPGATTDSRVRENSTDITLTSQEVADIEMILESFEVQGERYGHGKELLEG